MVDSPIKIMDARVLLIVVVALLGTGYLVYGRFVARQVGVDPSRPTPAHTKYDGVDYVPARQWLVLFGHHFSSICAAGPIVGPALAGLLGATALGETLPVMAAFAISLIATVLIVAALPESDPCQLNENPEETNVSQVLGPDQKECYRLKGAQRLSSLGILRLPKMALILSLHFLVFLAFNFFYIAFPVHAATTIEWSLTQIGIYFSIISLFMVLVQGPVLKWATKRASDRTLVLIGSVLLAMSFPFFGTGNTLLLYTGAALLAIWLAGPEKTERLETFYSKVRPPGFWGPVAAAAGDDPGKGQRSLARAVAAMLLCGLSVFCLLVGIGSWLVGSPPPVWFPWAAPWSWGLVITGLALAPAWWALGRSRHDTTA